MGVFGRWLLAGLVMACLPPSWAQVESGQVVPRPQSPGQWVTEYLVGSPWSPNPNTGWQPSAEQACAMVPDMLNRQGVNQGRQCGSRLVTPTCCGVMVFNDTPGACTSGYMCDRAGGFSVVSQNRWVSSGGACPANSTPLDETRCQCLSGFQAEGGQCVRVLMPPLGCAAGEGGFTACPGNMPWTAAVPPAPGTPQEGGPNSNAGEPGQDSAPDPTQVDADPGSSGGSCRAVEAVGNPIFAATGNKYQREVDYVGPNGLSLVRYYNSSLPAWVHNFSVRVLAHPQRTFVIRPDGRGLYFSGSSEGVLMPEIGTSDQLERLPTTDASQPRWKYTSAATGATEWFDGQGRLQRIVRRNGQAFQAEQADGLLAAITDPWGRRLRFVYDAQRRLVAVITPEGREIRYGYDSSGRLARVQYPDASMRQYLYEDTRWPLALTGVVDERGVRQASWAYDSEGRAKESVLAGGIGRFQLAFAPRSVSILDPLGTQRNQAYFRAGARWHFSGQDMACPGCIGDAAARGVDAASGLTTRTTDFLGTTHTVNWFVQRRLPARETQAVGLPEQRVREYEWHPSFALPVRVSEGGRTTQFTYDAAGNLLSQTVTDTASGEARRWGFTYNAQGQVTGQTDPAGSAWRKDYDSLGNLQSVQDPLGQVYRFTHDVNGGLVSQVDPVGVTTTFTRDARGRVVARSVGGETTRFAYTPDGKLAVVIRPNGHETHYDYDAAGRLVVESDNRGMRIVYDLDAAGHRIRETVFDASGQAVRTLQREFRPNGLLASQRNVSGTGSRFEHDANGRLIAETDALSQVTRRTLDKLGRTEAVTFADNQSARQAWNARDDLTQVTDPKGVSTRYDVNAFGEVVSETSPDIGVRRYVRDARGAVVQAEDAKGQVTRIERDALGQPVRMIGADGRQTTLAYTATGRLESVTDSSNRIQFEHDSQGRVVLKRQYVDDPGFISSAHVVQYRWRDGDLDSVEYPSGLTVRYRREAGRVVGIDAQRPWRHLSVLTSLAKMTPRPVVDLVTNLTHTALGQPRAWGWFNGDSANRTFEDGRLVSTEFARYTHDAAGRIIGIAQELKVRHPAVAASGTAGMPVTWQVGYDTRNRIARFEGAGASLRYTYDANSNRLAAVESVAGDALLAPAKPLTRDSRIDVEASSNRTQRITQTSAQAGQPDAVDITTLGFDANGALTSDGRRWFDYDAAGRLSAVRWRQPEGELVVPYLHNVLDQRIFKGVQQASDGEAPPAPPPPEPARPASADTDPSVFMQWVMDFMAWLSKVMDRVFKPTVLGTIYVHGDGPLPEWALLGEYDNGTPMRQPDTEYIWLPTEDGGAIPIAMYRDGRFYAIHTDHLGTPRLVTDDTNQPVWQWAYSAFGDNRPIGALEGALLQPTAPAIRFNLGMPGQYWDEESGLYDNYHRTYCAHCGGYVQPDPIGLEGGLNRFAYVGGNPLSYTDPTGEFAILLPALPTLGGWAASAAGAAAGAVLGWNVFGPMLAKPPENAYDPNGPKAPGKPGEAEGFKDPKGGENWVPNPNPGKGGSGYGWQDAKGDVWCPTGPAGPGSRAHGGPHWDVQTPGGGYRNERPRR